MVNTILGRVLEAFFLVVLQCLDSCSAGRLMLQPDLGLIMATEPDAVLLDDAMAFYVPRNQESFDGAAFVAALKSPGELGTCVNVEPLCQTHTCHLTYLMLSMVVLPSATAGAVLMANVMGCKGPTCLHVT